MQDDLSLNTYDYDLPQKNIAQFPSPERDGSKLLILDSTTKNIEHRHFSDITTYFNEGDILVVNDTRVFPARLNGCKATGGKVEVFILELPQKNTAVSAEKCTAETHALIKSSKRPAVGSSISLTDELSCTIIKHYDFGKAKILLEFPKNTDLIDVLSNCGSVPLPPYIERKSGTTSQDKERYQTVYAEKSGAVAAPTAGLHFTPAILKELSAKGVEIARLTLHVGYGTFAPVRVDDIKDHQIHSEWVELSQNTAMKINKAKENGGKVWAVGTTSVRALEFCSNTDGQVESFAGWCDLYIVPGYSFSVIDNLITNFHLPKSSLLFLVSALCGRSTLMNCYQEAIDHDYRFYSYGDAMAIIF